MFTAGYLAKIKPNYQICGSTYLLGNKGWHVVSIKDSGHIYYVKETSRNTLSWRKVR